MLKMLHTRKLIPNSIFNYKKWILFSHSTINSIILVHYFPKEMLHVIHIIEYLALDRYESIGENIFKNRGKDHYHQLKTGF